jgi:hypothetical protein
VGDPFTVFQLRGSSIFKLGFVSEITFLISVFEFVEAALGLIVVGILIAYLSTMYVALSRRRRWGSSDRMLEFCLPRLLVAKNNI